MNSIQFKNVTKSYGDVTVLKNINLTIHPGERLILLGPSGCGKSTLLRMIAGLTEVTTGDIYFGEERVNDLEAGDRNVAFVFQNYALYPHMTVEKNVTYALKAHKMDKDEIKRRSEEAISMLGLAGYENRKPKELSGGQRQRVALARAVVKRSDFFLLDEPLSNLDAQLRHHARKELLKIHRRFNQTFIYVTHDQIEAMTVGHRVALLHEGEIQMIDTPDNIYNYPANLFTAKFIGSPSCNTLDATYENGKLLLGEHAIPVADDWKEKIEQSGTKDLVFGLRPEHIILTTDQTENAIKVKIESMENYGSQQGYYFKLGDKEWVCINSEYTFTKSDEVYLNIDFTKIHLFNRETTKSIGYPGKGADVE